VAAGDSVEAIRRAADEVVALHIPEWFGAVGSFYGEFAQVSDEDVIALMKSVTRQGSD
jgi:putative phosphoribosyl transferase